eukprot:CAMPEP_0117040020 /NCGR_PEP_ID=MMETSP0472-20121206/28041_1 /TAXON_ID=693140 ORGANISM="Tiarina fusus, Strain LIS" /NCGR_SAMPLE_ID=MMETSP0472 /ASSEMBLY_ACC=CAM_ASM_000603 /LENGTH=256 /DNA_ID=CAMNT_0004750653 /DNA_START=65 /DNA_END=835 /DNA_ORIENTATION=-
MSQKFSTHRLDTQRRDGNRPQSKPPASSPGAEYPGRADDDASAFDDRKRKVLEHTLEELQNERDRLREKNRTNSQRFRDRKKDFMDTLFEEKYRLGKDNNELKTEKEKLQKLLQEALAEKKLNELEQRKSALLVAKRTMPTPSVLYQDSLILPTSRYEGAGLPFGYSGAGMGAGLGMSKGLFPGLTATGMLGLGASSLSPYLKEEASFLGSSATGLGMGASGLISELPSQMGALGYLERRDRFRYPSAVQPEDVNS